MTPEAVPDRWLEVRVQKPEDAAVAERVPDVLLEMGGRAIVEEDGWILTHVPEPADVDGFIDRTRGALESWGVDGPEIETRWQVQEDWAESWKSGLAPRRITDRLVVRPSWTDFDPRPTDKVIVLDPGIAFGTAEHGTTRGCLRLLDRTVRPGDRVLDVGSGSGILSVAALLLGARAVVGIEGDPYACTAALENAAANGVTDGFEVVEAWADAGNLAEHGPADLVVANIETHLLRPLLPGLVAACARPGRLILSGILDHQWEGVRAEMEALHCVSGVVDADGEWRAGVFLTAPT